MLFSLAFLLIAGWWIAGVLFGDSGRRFYFLTMLFITLVIMMLGGGLCASFFSNLLHWKELHGAGIEAYGFETGRYIDHLNNDQSTTNGWAFFGILPLMILDVFRYQFYFLFKDPLYMVWAFDLAFAYLWYVNFLKPPKDPTKTASLEGGYQEIQDNLERMRKRG